jgi:hypothetical protein
VRLNAIYQRENLSNLFLIKRSKATTESLALGVWNLVAAERGENSLSAQAQ